MAEIQGPEFFMEDLLRQLNLRALEAAEPHIGEALKKIERDMREQIAARLIGLIEGRVAYHHNRQELVIKFGPMSRENDDG